MTPEELVTRQSLEILNNTILDLCLRRDQLAASLPRMPRPKPMTHGFNGMEIKQGGGVKRKKQA